MNAMVEAQNQVAVSDGAAVMQVIARVASDPSVDVAKLEKLLDMQERIMAKNAEMAFNADFAMMQSELPTIMENGEIRVNGVLRSKYARFEDINEAVKPVLQKYGFAITFKTDTGNGVIRVVGILAHRQGHRESTDMVLPVDASGSKNPVQAVGSSVSYGKRYVIEALLNLTSRGQDDDGQSVSKVQPDPEGKKILEACGSIDALKRAWAGLSEQQRKTLDDVMTECRRVIREADRRAAA